MELFELTHATDADVFGAKAARLAHLTRNGISVPRGFCLPVGWADGNGHKALVDALPGPLSDLGAIRVAVRSSALGEDDVVHSFAGVFTTILNVPATPNDVAQAVQKVLASVDSPSAKAYRSLHGLPRLPVTAFIQPMVDPTLAGVLFTQNPITREAHYVAEYVTGLGDSVVNGGGSDYLEMTPSGEVLQQQSRDNTLMSPDIRRELASVGRRCMSILGCPQDIEWAVVGRLIWVLQSRPITA